MIVVVKVMVVVINFKVIYCRVLMQSYLYEVVQLVLHVECKSSYMASNQKEEAAAGSGISKFLSLVPRPSVNAEPSSFLTKGLGTRLQVPGKAIYFFSAE